ncbi:MAG TPA: nucleoside monophosphate kinase [Parcubacteria group bacterium]|jgi:adenylate kinase family enzyme|nr:nucleoside monophosphate kinase [Parcubacteria group bacterium]
MTPQTFIFIGRSGCGKGTQAELLMQKLKEKDDSNEIFYLETGQKFRDFTSSGGYTSGLSKEIQSKGGLQPSFLAVWIWSSIFVEKINKDQHLFIDGTPRKFNEALILAEAMKFYGRKPYVVYIDVGRTWAEERLSSRHREDDLTLMVKSRLDWFDTDVVPVVEYFKSNTDVDFISVNGEQSIEEVHNELLSKLGW